MRSVKPGRGPSFLNGITSVVVGVIAIGWIATASHMGAPGIFTLFGLGFVVLAAVSAVYNFMNATGKSRFSAFDITRGEEEPDPLNARFGAKQAGGICPNCENVVDVNYAHCPHCGEKL
jgi:hypothetical protein